MSNTEIMDYLFIVNPVSGKGRAKKILPIIEDFCRKKNFNYRIFETKHQAHATEIAGENEKLTRSIIAVGGDGTINEIVNGFGDEAAVNLGVLPVGSGNDFIKNLNYPNNIKDTLSLLTTPEIQVIKRADLGLVTFKEDGSTNSKTRKFINSMGIGFDANVGYINQEIKLFNGLLSYIYAVIKALFKYEMIELSKLNGIKGEIDKKLMISIGNGICSGGGFYLNPDAKIDDGLLNISVFDKVTRRRLLTALPWALLNKLEKVPEAKLETAEYLEIELKNPYYTHCDGEIISQKLKSAEIKVLKNKINIITSR